MTRPHNISIMGATGSIGKSALDVVRHANACGDQKFKIVALAAGSDAEGLAAQAREFDADVAVIADETQIDELRSRLAGTNVTVDAGLSAVVEAASRPVDRLLAAIVGSAGLESTIAAVRAGNDVAIANKESVVCGGKLILREAARRGVKILPVDSEHSAIFQCIGDGRSLEKMTITASGGPFRKASLEEMRSASPQQAAAHPNWSMGVKNSIDSATLMNKALEFIEAGFLFDVGEDQLDVLVHPQSIIHGMAHFSDGSVIAQLGAPDMKTPISYALAWPDRTATNVDRLDLAKLGSLDFESVDEDRFPAIRLARCAYQHGAAATTVLNCANEVAVSAFIAGQCGFLDISWLVEQALSRYLEGSMQGIACETLEEIAFLDRMTREMTRDILGSDLRRMGG